MKVNLITKVEINANPPAVFKYLQDLKYHNLWNPHLQSIVPIIILEEGVVYRTQALLLGITVRGRNKVTKLVVNKELQLENKSGMIHYAVNYLLKSLGKSTTLTCTTTISTDNIAIKFTSSVLKMLARRELEADLQALKIAVEQQLSA